MELFSYFRSSAAFRVRLALNLKGIPHTITPISLMKGEEQSADYLALNPQGFVPALRLDNGRVLTQSQAIIEYLEETYPAKPLFAADPIVRAEQRAFAAVIACDIHPLNNLRVLNDLEQRFGAGNEQKDLWYRHWIKEGFEVLEGLLQNHAGRFTWGDTPSLGDVFLLPQTFNALRFNVPMEAYPTIMAIYHHCLELPEIVAATPAQQVDAF
ncbi:MAG: maleylacetoacetate isomerase [Thiofilum sp.]|uniref:maleylacetoacetate isomerase n=1 Tax=Thiofilum sp. TaxID=2212733 RepID=UPI0025D3DAAD|nr:maleylacetoacetate isomerase [Thiofilum sp.]MBK8454573.1 maleylacetoacetate isomerase [Thiofilum sp.]